MDGLYTPSSNDELVKYGSAEVRSAFFKEHVRVAAYMCYVSSVITTVPDYSIQ